jgi:hypothetical protein
MKKSILILALLSICFIAKAQCLSGNCENGNGIMNYSDGKYEGNYVNKLKEGKGTMIWKNGETYTGDFKNNLFNGNGKYSWPQGIIYEGEWVDNNRNGKGKVIFSDGTTQQGIYVKNIYMEGMRILQMINLKLKRNMMKKAKWLVK